MSDDQTKHAKLHDTDLPKQERLEALVEVFDGRVHGPNGPAYQTYNDAARVLEAVINDEEPPTLPQSE